MPRLMGVLKARPKDRVIVASGVYDMVSLRMAAAMGFEALYMTGYGTVASHLGLPDAGLSSYADMVSRVEATARMAETPLIADGDTGYGGLLNVRHAVRAKSGQARRRSSSRTIFCGDESADGFEEVWRFDRAPTEI
jgi:2,3-dimethylmalate lyase